MSDPAFGVLDLDRAATTPVHPDVLAGMLPYFSQRSGNPASVHATGRLARRAVEDARERVAAAVGVRPRHVVFTSGATEALQLGLRGYLAERSPAHVVSGLSEHAAVREALRACALRGAEVTWLRPDERGCVSPEGLLAALRPDTALVALMRVNNETGVRHDLAPLRDELEAKGVRVLVDAVQAFG